MNEEDRAIALLLLQRGLTTPDALRRTADVVLARRAAGQRAEVLPVLVELGALSREAAAEVWRARRGEAPTDLALPAASRAPAPQRPSLPPPPPLPALPPLPAPSAAPSLQPDSGEFDPTGAFEALAAPPPGDVLGFGPPPTAPPAPLVPPAPASEVPTALGLPAAAPAASQAPVPRAASPPVGSSAPLEAAPAPRPTSGRAARRGASSRLGARRTPAVLPLAGAAVVALLGFVAVAVWVVVGGAARPAPPPGPAAPASTPGPAATEPGPPPLAQVEPEAEADRVAEDLLSRASDLVWERERYEEAVTLLEGFPPRLRAAPVYAEVAGKLADYRRYAQLRRELEQAIAAGAAGKGLRRWIARIEGGHLAEDAYGLPCVERFRERARALLGAPAYDALALEAADLDEAAERRSPGLDD